MEIKKYEIDVLEVGAADAILIHFFDEYDNGYIVSVDAGNYSDGKTVSDFIKKHYNSFHIDLAICTHCDADHFGGYIWMLEDMKSSPEISVDIKRIWINDPGYHVDINDYKYRRNQEAVIKEARSVFTLPGTQKNLLSLIDNIGIIRQEAFSDGENSYSCGYALEKSIEVMGRTQKYYEQLVPIFHNELKPYDDDSEDDDNVLCENKQCLSKAMDDAEDDASAHNQSSIIILFKPADGRKFLFTGDMGADAYNNMEESDRLNIGDVYWLKVPHHGSKHNLCSDIIRHINPQVAYISTAKYGHYLSKAVVNALKRIGCRVYVTTLPVKGSIQHQCGLDTHDGYSSATEL